MTLALVLALLTLLGVGLVLADRTLTQAARRRRQLLDEVATLKVLLISITKEVTLQIEAGNPDFGELALMIHNHRELEGGQR